MSFATIADFVETNVAQQPPALHNLFFRKFLCVFSRVKSLQRIFTEMSIKDHAESKPQVETSFNLVNTQRCGSVKKEGRQIIRTKDAPKFAI